MKLKTISTLIIISLLFSACESWLEVTPHGSMTEDDAYSNTRSTRTALNGLYLELTDNSLYGRNLTCGMIEIFALHYLVEDRHIYEDYAKHHFTSAGPKSALSNTWQHAYKTIAYCNEFLTQLKLKKEQYPPADYNIYRGEALALRTLLHFDMLRLFGPIYLEDKDKEAIPYCVESSNNAVEISKAEEVMSWLLKDINEVVDLLQNDPVLEFGVNETVQNIDYMNDYRNFRMNLYAALFLKCRMLLYAGDNAAAYEIVSNLLIGERSEHFLNTFKFMGTSGDINEFMFFPEMVFCSHNAQRDEINKELFSPQLDISQLLAGGIEYIKYLYGPTAIGGEDENIRYKIWEGTGREEVKIFRRYQEGTRYEALPFRSEIQCMMRLGELYLIAAETAPDLDKKRFWLEALRSQRGFKPDNTKGMTEEELDELIHHEFIKETYGDGQYFFFAKRKFIRAIRDQKNSSYAMSKDKYVPKLPEGEIDYRYQSEN